MSRFVATVVLVIAATQAAGAGQQVSMASAFVDSAAGLTLEAAIAKAIGEEPSLRAVRAEVDVARGGRLQAGLRPNPSASFAHQIEPRGTDRQTRVDVEWPLDLFRKAGRVNAADRELETTRHAIADRERLLAADVRLKYGEVLAAVRELSVSDELVSATARQHELVAGRVAEGAAPPLDRDMLRVELQRLEADRLLQLGHAEHALIELKRLLGLAADASLKLRDDLEQLTLRELALLIPGESAATRPDVKEAEGRVQLSEARVDQARREGRFDASVFGMYMRTDSGFPQRAFGPGPGNDLEQVRGLFHYWAGGLTVTVPLRDRNQGGVASAEAKRVRAAAEHDAARLTAESEVAAARTRDEHARRAVAAYGSGTVALARQNLNVIDQTHALGRLTLLDVLAERRRYLDIERAYTNALREAYDARQTLRRALGAVK